MNCGGFEKGLCRENKQKRVIKTKKSKIKGGGKRPGPGGAPNSARAKTARTSSLSHSYTHFDLPVLCFVLEHSLSPAFMSSQHLMSISS